MTHHAESLPTQPAVPTTPEACAIQRALAAFARAHVRAHVVEANDRVFVFSLRASPGTYGHPAVTAEIRGESVRVIGERALVEAIEAELARR